MRIAQIVLPGVSFYEKKSQEIDRNLLAKDHDVYLAASTAELAGADVAHVYASSTLPRAFFRRFPIPYIASADIPTKRFSLLRPVEPDYVVSPLEKQREESRHQTLPEVVADAYFDWERVGGAGEKNGARRIGTFTRGRREVIRMVEHSALRIARVRDDVEWLQFEEAPSPEDLAAVELWVDPATDPNDFDGYVAEALTMGNTVVASRTPINVQRLEGGRGGFLVPPDDPNELTHAILAALFKPEAVQPKLDAARQMLSRFRPFPRIRILAHIYETLRS